MGAKVLILAKSLIPNFLRACAIVHCDIRNATSIFDALLVNNYVCLVDRIEHHIQNFEFIQLIIILYKHLIKTRSD